VRQIETDASAALRCSAADIGQQRPSDDAMVVRPSTFVFSQHFLHGRPSAKFVQDRLIKIKQSRKIS